MNMNAGVNVKEFPIKAEVEGREGSYTVFLQRGGQIKICKPSNQE